MSCNNEAVKETSMETDGDAIENVVIENVVVENVVEDQPRQNDCEENDPGEQEPPELALRQGQRNSYSDSSEKVTKEVSNEDREETALDKTAILTQICESNRLEKKKAAQDEDERARVVRTVVASRERKSFATTKFAEIAVNVAGHVAGRNSLNQVPRARLASGRTRNSLINTKFWTINNRSQEQGIEQGAINRTQEQEVIADQDDPENQDNQNPCSEPTASNPGRNNSDPDHLVEATLVDDTNYVVVEASPMREQQIQLSNCIPRTTGSKLLCFGLSCLIVIIVITGVIICIIQLFLCFHLVKKVLHC